MTKNEAMEKAKQIIDNDKRKTILEKRLVRLENLIKNESADDPAEILLGAMDDGYISAEALCRELIAQMSVDELWSVCDALDLVEESKKESDKPVKNEDMDDEDEDDSEYNSYDICREILDYYGASDWIGESDIDEYLDDNYPDMNSDDRWFVHDRMDKFANVDPYRSVQDEDDEDWDEEDDEDWDEDDEDFESHKRSAKRPVKNESVKKPAKRSLVSRYKK